MPIPYCPYYCEENAWRLLAATALVAGPAEALLIANRSGRVACWEQRAADPGEPVLWDYHVVVVEYPGPDLAGSEAVRPRVWDPDCRHRPVLDAATWLAVTFLAPSTVRPRYVPRFRPVARERWVRELATNRSHMRYPDGRWRKPPSALGSARRGRHEPRELARPRPPGTGSTAARSRRAGRGPEGVRASPAYGPSPAVRSGFVVSVSSP